MSGEIRVPALGESIVEATIGKWMKRVGDSVAAGEALVDLETDKVNVEVAAEQDGVLEQILKDEGQNVGVGEVIGTIGAGAAAGQHNGSSTGVSQPLAGAPAPAGTGGTSAPRRDLEVSGEPQPAVPAGDERETRATPVAKRMAAEQGVDIRAISGSGPGGRVTKDDVSTQLRPDGAPGHQADTAIERQSSAPPTMPAPQPPSAPEAQAPSPKSQAPADGRREERVRMTRRRQTIAQRLVESQRTAAMLTTFNEIDMSAVMEVRRRRKDSFKERHGIGLGFMSFFTKASIGALKAFPTLNAEIQGSEIVIKHYYDIGIAVGVEEGLVVPVLRDADRKSFAQIEREIAALAVRARENKLTLNELQGGTFTITNGGVFGSLMSTPILNAPQVGILGMHKIEERPIALGGQVIIRPMMYVALSYDHRIVDGNTAVRFLVRIKELIEDPETLLLEG
ncbi:MAG: 2-oxoglutarate dehydrogenase complex dihydrolipoyllysine-residue succinyltransferase [Kouleothrix sp.]|nr:2-oxoglutarate dehydrogenase complex dihydrolipoyllysine-residue succinyltransferase [Kouleothrix sp.]